MDVPKQFALALNSIRSAARSSYSARGLHVRSPTMFEDRSLKLDLCALALLALVAFLGVSLWTYDATDPPSTLVWPASETIHNACGRAGAMAAHHLFESLGIGAYYLAGSLAVLTFLLVVRREIDQPVLADGRLGRVDRGAHDAGRAGRAELDARSGGWCRRIRRRDGPQPAGNALRPSRRVHLRGERAAGRACCSRRITSCSARPR